MNKAYSDFLSSKELIIQSVGIDTTLKMNGALFDFQKDIVRWSLRKGRSALFEDCGLGKGQPYGSKILTSKGWKANDRLKIGDLIIGSDGKGYKVKGIYKRQEQNIFRVYFSDNASFVVDKDHLHIVRTNNDRQRGKKWRVSSTEDLLMCNNLRYGKEGKSRNYDIPIVKPIIFNKKYGGSITPYVLGVLLGGGCLRYTVSISSKDIQVIDRVRKELSTGASLKKIRQSKYDYRIITGLCGNRRHFFRGELLKLNLLKKLSYEKHIPDDYLLNQLPQDRLDLLRGLMDTDGYIGKDGCSQFYSVSKKLAEGVLFLVRSLGGIPKLSVKKSFFAGKRYKDCYAVTFSLKVFNPFFLKRKADRWNSDPRDNGRWIDRIEFEGKEETICLSVDSPDSSYVTENFIITHNTVQQLEWSRHVCAHTKGKVLILAPLAVNQQTYNEGRKFGIRVNMCESQNDIIDGINITNYEKLHKFNASEFTGIVLDESSILKSFSGKYRNLIISSFKDTPYKLACTATPAPNDFMELGNHSEFLGVMTRAEMLAMFFVHDGGDTSKWRLKGHSEDAYWKWLCSWAVYLRKPSDLGYEDKDFILPKLNVIEHIINNKAKPKVGFFGSQSLSLNDRRRERSGSVMERVEKCVELVKSNNGSSWLMWCDLNVESKAIKNSVENCVEITGSDKIEVKAKNMIGFSTGDFNKLVTKPKIAGFGMNWQHCSNVIFVGLSDSFESYYQAIRRVWRFGQKKEVNCHIVISKREYVVLQNIKRKELDAERMANNMIKHMSDINSANIKRTRRRKVRYFEKFEEGKNWKMYSGDCVDIISRFKDNEIDYSIFSPPFQSLYTYSDSDRDMGNCRSENEFFEHFSFLVKELYRVTKAGRLVSIHCMNLPYTKQSYGFIGLQDFRGDLIRCFQKFNWIFHSEVCIWKDPVVSMQRTKSLRLLHKQLVKDSSMSGMGIPDYVITMRKQGDNEKPISGEFKEYVGSDTLGRTINLTKKSIDIWQRYASPVWMDIRQGNTLQRKSVREDKDERHICPLQLDVIKRCLQLWTNKRDVVLDPFAGIGSSGYVALNFDRKFIGIELKESYNKQAVSNLRTVERRSII